MGLPESDTTKHRQSSSCTWVPSLGGEDALEKGNSNGTPVFLPGKSDGQRSLAGHSPEGRRRVGHDLAIKRQQPRCEEGRELRGCDPTHSPKVEATRGTELCHLLAAPSSVPDASASQCLPDIP